MPRNPLSCFHISKYLKEVLLVNNTQKLKVCGKIENTICNIFSNTSANLVKRTMRAKTCQLKERVEGSEHNVHSSIVCTFKNHNDKSFTTNNVSRHAVCNTWKLFVSQVKSISFVKSLVHFLFDVRILMLLATNQNILWKYFTW